MRTLFLLFAAMLACSCGRIVGAGDLSQEDYRRLKGLGLLQEGEKLFKFSSQQSRDVSGNFYSDLRLASYWIDEQDTSRTIVNSAFYPEIIALDTVPYAGLTYSPFIQVHKSDSTVFKVYFEDGRDELTELFRDVFRLWQEKAGKGTQF